MVTKVQKWGNSQGVRIGKEVLAAASVDVGDEVEVLFRDGEIVISPLSPIRRGMDLDELLSCMPDDYEPEQLEIGPPVGREVW